MIAHYFDPQLLLSLNGFNALVKLGDISSGRVIVAGTDYKTFLIQWACTKMAVLGDRCEDPWIIVATRQLFPSPIVVSIIETILRTRWGISSGELPKVPHNARESYSKMF